MTENRDDNDLPSISEPGFEEDRSSSSEVPRIEGYEVTGRLGEGGMGTVWRAVQLSTSRNVALKVLVRGVFSSDKARARFERETQLTARLHHPNIAQVFDSGVHQGVHYYVMELIDGAPLDQYVKEHHSTQRQILALMETVCEAIQHAHQRGVIHRDLKPSNILVTADGKPHVLDFGLAKDFSGQDFGLTVSGEGEAAGTPAYMSPEQAAGKLDQIDTRTDVYTLGVVLFRLLTGSSPHDLSGTRYEVLRRIAEEEVRRPREITKEVDRELEALLLKALARDPKDRYASAGVFAQDIENYLNGEPLLARPPTTGYFLRKRIRKYRGRVAIALSLLIVLVGGGVFSYVRIARERTRAQAIYRFLESILTSVDPAKARGREITLREALDDAAARVGTEFAGQPKVEAAVRMIIGQTYFALGRSEDAEKQHSEALKIRRRVLGEEHRDTLASMNNLGEAFKQGRKYDEAEEMHRRTLGIRRRLLGNEHPDTAQSLNNLADTLYLKGGNLDKAIVMFKEAFEVRRRLLGKEHRDTLESMNGVGVTLSVEGKYTEAEPFLSQCYELRHSALGEEHPLTLQSMNNLAGNLGARGKLDEAEAMYRQCAETGRRVLGDEHHATTLFMGNLSRSLHRRGKLDEAEAILREVLEIGRRLHGDSGVETLWALRRLAFLLERKGKLDEAEAMLREAVELSGRGRGIEAPETLSAMNNLAGILWRRGKLDVVEHLTRQILEIRRRVQGEKHPDTLWAKSNLTDLLEERRRLEGEGREEAVAATRITEGKVLAYDGFDSKLGLDWEILHPDPPHFSVARNPGSLTITTKDGGLPNADYRNLFLIDCPALPQQDFQITTCISSFKPVALFNQAGLICLEDDNNYVRFVYQWGDHSGQREFRVGAEAEGRRRTGASFKAPQELERVWLRITKRGNRYAFSTSVDGRTFLRERYPLFYGGIAAHCVAEWGDGSVEKVGLFAANGTNSQAPEIDASFDFFEVRALPGMADEAEADDETQ